MPITRRNLAVAGVLALGTSSLLRSSAVLASAADDAAVNQAVEALRKALLGADRAQLDQLAADQPSYGHSDGRVQTKAQFIDGVLNRKAIVKALTFPDLTVAVVGDAAIVLRTAYDALPNAMKNRLAGLTGLHGRPMGQGRGTRHDRFCTKPGSRRHRSAPLWRPPSRAKSG